MNKVYTGNWQNCEDNIEALLAIGVEVKWTKCWKYNFGRDASQYDDKKWKVLKDEQELKDSFDYKRVKEMCWGIPHWFDIEAYPVISYRVDDDKYPLFCVRYKEWCQKEDARIKAEMEREYEEWCEEQQRKLEAYLVRHPWAANPEGYQEGIDYVRVNDPDKGEVIVNLH